MGFQVEVQKYSPLIISILSLSFIIILTFSLRFQAANTMYLDNPYSDRDFDEMVYVPIAETYAEAIREWDWAEIITEEENPEHPTFGKILMGLGILLFGEGTIFDMDNLMAARFISIILATGISILLWKEFGLFPALFWAISSYSIKYTAQAYLEASLSFFALLALIMLYYIRKTGDKWWNLSAIFSAAAFAAKYPGLLVGGTVFLLMAFLDEEEDTPRSAGFLSKSKLQLNQFVNKKFVQKILLWGVIFTVSFCIFNPRTMNSPTEFIQSIFFHYDYSQGEEAMDPDPFKQFDWLLGETNPTIWHEHFPIVYLDGILFIGSIFGLAFLASAAYNKETKELSVKYTSIIVFYFVNIAFLVLWQTKWPQYLTMFEIPMAISCGYMYSKILRFAFWGESESKKLSSSDCNSEFT